MPYSILEKKTYTVQRGDIVINVDLFDSVTPLPLETVYFPVDGYIDMEHLVLMMPVAGLMNSRVHWSWLPAGCSFC